MKLGGYTLIEGIVSMVLMSILLTVGIIVSFNLYKSYPSNGKMMMEVVLNKEIREIIERDELGKDSYELDGFLFDCQVTMSATFKNMAEVNATLTDSLGHKVEQKRLFLHYEK